MHVTYVLGASWGGIPHYAVELANAMSEYADVTVVKPKDSNTKHLHDRVVVEERFMPLSRDSPISVGNLRNFWSYRDAPTEEGDIIHYVHTPPQIMLFRSIIGRNNNMPEIATIHATFEGYVDILREEKFPLNVLSIMSEWIQYNSADFDEYIVHSEGNIPDIKEEGIKSESISVVPHGAISLFQEDTPIDVSQQSSADTVLFFGYIKETKGLDTLIEAAIDASSDVDDLDVIIAGQGDLSSYSDELNRDLFTVHNRFISDEEVPTLFQQADVVVLPYNQHSGQSGVLSVALSFGKPVIATSVGDFPDLIDKGGIVVPPNDSVSLREAIVKMLSDEELRSNASRHAAQKADQLSWNNIAETHLDIYRSHLE